jgi:hypothetical protein
VLLLKPTIFHQLKQEDLLGLQVDQVDQVDQEDLEDLEDQED